MNFEAVVAFAADNAGNPATASTSFRVIATLESTISDAERAYELGWITKKSVKNEIVNKLKKAVRIEKKIEIIKEKQQDGTEIERKVKHLERKVDKILLKLLLKDLEKWHIKGLINDSAYTLLREDIEWLLNN